MELFGGDDLEDHEYPMDTPIRIATDIIARNWGTLRRGNQTYKWSLQWDNHRSKWDFPASHIG